MSRVHVLVAGGGAAAALFLAVLIAFQIPAAASLSVRTARVVALHKDAALLAGQADSLRAITAATQQRAGGTTAEGGLVARRAKRARGSKKKGSTEATRPCSTRPVRYRRDSANSSTDWRSRPPAVAPHRMNSAESVMVRGYLAGTHPAKTIRSDASTRESGLGWSHA